MAPLYIHDENDFFCNEEDASTASMGTSTTASSFSSSSTSDESPAAPIQTPRARRSVSFSAGAAVHWGAVMNVEDYTEHEKFECWYQVEEMREIRKDVKDTIAFMNQNIPIDKSVNDITVSTRGLEGKTRTGKRRRREARLASLAAVFDEQTLQEMDCIIDPVMIAMAYTEYTYPMQVAAFERAAIFQKEAKEIYESSNIKISNSCDESEKADVLAETKGCSDENEVLVGPKRYDLENNESTPSVNNVLEMEETDDDNSDNDSSTNTFLDNSVRDDGATDEKSSKDQHNKDFGEDEDDLLQRFDRNINIRPYILGPLRIREKFACFLPGAASNRRPAIMGAFRVVHIWLQIPEFAFLIVDVWMDET